MNAADLNLNNISVTSATNLESDNVLQLLGKTKYTVFIALDKDCPVVQKYIPAINDLYNKYQNLEFNILLISRPSNLTANQMEEFINTYKVKPAVYLDRDNKLLQALGIKTISQAVLVDNKKMVILYSGRIDDKVNYDSVKEYSTNNYLEKAIVSALAGKKVKVQKVKTLGCAI